ncbi:hypothetical protein LCGC14_0788030 [marine sediment metagenome]|uniref:Uncharacterized protein n=1 Tax=marine sediment metagenome TaxID=412755 RepID=A0A0F9T0L7_9ZZZZ
MRYRTRKTAQYWDCEELRRLDLPSSISVHENNDSEFTGLFDKHGNEIYRVSDRVKVGFDLN